MGVAFRRLRIPVGAVLASPTFRALQTAELARFPTPRTHDDLGETDRSMSSDLIAARTGWLRALVTQSPRHGTNTVIVSHYPNITAAFARDAKDFNEGEALVFRPDGHGGAALVGRVKIEEWPALASATLD